MILIFRIYAKCYNRLEQADVILLIIDASRYCDIGEDFHAFFQHQINKLMSEGEKPKNVCLSPDQNFFLVVNKIDKSFVDLGTMVTLENETLVPVCRISCSTKAGIEDFVARLSTHITDT